jgi:hypothetical protein
MILTLILVLAFAGLGLLYMAPYFSSGEMMDIPVMMGIGLFGLVMLTAAPVFIIEKLKENEGSSALGYGFIMLLLGFAFIVAWLWE